MSDTKTLENFQKLQNAEDYLEFFAIEYDREFVNVNRLHILKQFSDLLSEVDGTFPDVSEAEKLEKYRLALEESYEVFKTKTPRDTKLFKVFKDKQEK